MCSFLPNAKYRDTSLIAIVHICVWTICAHSCTAVFVVSLYIQSLSTCSKWSHEGFQPLTNPIVIACNNTIIRSVCPLNLMLIFIFTSMHNTHTTLCVAPMRPLVPSLHCPNSLECTLEGSVSRPANRRECARGVDVCRPMKALWELTVLDDRVILHVKHAQSYHDTPRHLGAALLFRNHLSFIRELRSERFALFACTFLVEEFPRNSIDT